jgi:ribosome-associated toxin RatA of RatAB toxin-antitoxin module
MNKVIQFPYKPLYRLYLEIGKDIDTYEQFLEWLVSAVIVDSRIRERVLSEMTKDTTVLCPDID